MRALVLSGGGSKGAYHAGAVRALAEQGCEYDLFCGVSVGAINAAGLAQYVNLSAGAEFLTQMWNTTKTDNVAKKRFLAPLCLLWAPSIYTVEPLKQLLNANLDTENFLLSGKKLHILATALNSGTARVFDTFGSKEALVDAIIASSVAPLIYPPHKMGKGTYVDGGIRDTSPLAAAIRAGATHVDLVLCESKNLPTWDKEAKTALDYAPRVLEIMLNEIIENDIAQTGLHTRIKQLDSKYRKREVFLRVCRPLDPLEADSTVFDPAVSKKLMRQGYEDAQVQFV